MTTTTTTATFTTGLFHSFALPTNSDCTSTSYHVQQPQCFQLKSLHELLPGFSFSLSTTLHLKKEKSSWLMSTYVVFMVTRKGALYLYTFIPGVTFPFFLNTTNTTTTTTTRSRSQTEMGLSNSSSSSSSLPWLAYSSLGEVVSLCITKKFKLQTNLEEEKKTPLILVVNSEGQLFVLQCKPTASIILEKTFLSTTSTSTTNPPSWASLLKIQLIQKISIPLNVTHFVINPYYTQEGVWECVWEGCILEFNFLSF
ncbi:hypothetical protein HMI54_014502 [Coelomomyces lativittatus]|nr:hypothetical protein HMI54_014502 [Coelomomyces lativittatus]